MKLTRKYLKKLVLESLEESQYYYDARDLDTDYGYQAVELGQQMGDEDDRDRAAQVDKYVSLKVNKELKKAIEEHTKELVKDLTNEAAQNAGLFDDDDEEYFEKTWNELEGLYTRALRRPIQAMKEFDGSQQSIDKWIDTLKSVERILYKARDPGMYYLGRLAPDNLIIGDAYNTGNKWDLDGWDYEWDKMSVKPETAVKEAEDFFRPAIMKTIMGIQTKKSGVDVPDMMGLSEDENIKKKLTDVQPTVLEEGWKDQWPNEFGYLLKKITNSIDKYGIFEEVLVKIFYKVGRVNFLTPVKFFRSAKYKVIHYADEGIKKQKKKIDDLVNAMEYIKNLEPVSDWTQEHKDQGIENLERSLTAEREILDKFEEFKALADDPFYFGKERSKEIIKQSKTARRASPNDILPVMRISNKLIKSIRKQLKRWRDDNATGTDVYSYVDYALSDFDRSIKSQEDWAYEKTFEGDLAVLVQFIKSLRGNQEDLGKKLMSIVNKGKDLKETEFIEAINKFVDEGRQNEFVDCKDTKGDVPCVFLRLDDGTYWHRTSVDYCEITQNKMANCGAASDPTGMLYNLMSDEGGITKYYITLEHSKSKNKVIQVLGKANTLPKEKYWPAITEFFEAMGNPLLSKDAFVHMYNDVEDENTKEEIDKKIEEFVEGIGASMIPPPAIDSWKSMREQIRSGYYSDTVEKQPFNTGPLTNMFRAAIIQGKDDGRNATMMLNIKMVMQTITNRIYSRTSYADLSKMIEEDTKRLKEYAKSGELKKEILDYAVPEKYLDSQREIHLKYSKSSDPRISMRSNGAIVISVNFFFDVRLEPWNEARGEYLAENLNQLTKDTADQLERVGLSTVFAISPERAALVYPEEAKRLADVEDIIRDMNLDEGKKKMKLDRNYLTSMILEVLGESSDDELLRDLFNSGDPAYVNQALETLITLERIPDPVQIDVNETWGSVYIKFNSNGELRQLIDLLDEYGFTQQLGSSAQTPAYFVHKPLVSKRAEPYRGDQEPPKPPLPTGLTLKL